MRSDGLTIQSYGVSIKTSTLDFIMYGLSYCSSRSTRPPIFEGKKSNACWNNQKTVWKIHHFPIIQQKTLKNGGIHSIPYKYIYMHGLIWFRISPKRPCFQVLTWIESESGAMSVCQPMGNPRSHGACDGKVMGKSWDHP
jgi:hypothetical protein